MQTVATRDDSSVRALHFAEKSLQQERLIVYKINNSKIEKTCFLENFTIE